MLGSITDSILRLPGWVALLVIFLAPALESSVFLGRFTTILRVLVPGLAGMAEMHYPTFLAYNVAGGAIWGTGFVLLGYVGAASYHRVETFASGAGLVLLAVLVVGWAASRLVRRLREPDQAP